MSIQNRFLFLLAASLIHVSPPELCAGEDGTLEAMRTNLRQGWQRLKAIDESQRQYSVSVEFIAHAPNKVRKDVRSVDVHVSPPYCLGYAHFPDSGDEGVVARNPAYAFMIKKLKNTLDWQLGALGEGTDVKTNNVLTRAFTNSLSVANYYPLSAASALIPDEWLGNSGIEITKLIQDAQGRYQVSYTTRGTGPPHAKRNQPYHLESVMTVDPTLDWCVLEIDQHGVGLTANYHMTREVTREGPHLICRRITEKEMYVIPVERSWVFDNYKFDVKDTPEIFYLSHYSLPEPIGVKPPEQPRTWLWLIAGALVAAILALLFSWLKHRHAMKSLPSTPLPSDRILS